MFMYLILSIVSFYLFAFFCDDVAHNTIVTT